MARVTISQWSDKTRSPFSRRGASSMSWVGSTNPTPATSAPTPPKSGDESKSASESEPTFVTSPQARSSKDT
jgi:hypothetical protein